ncbi:unnamed protein product, partial [Polarella glacialis]
SCSFCSLKSASLALLLLAGLAQAYAIWLLITSMNAMEPEWIAEHENRNVTHMVVEVVHTAPFWGPVKVYVPDDCTFSNTLDQNLSNFLHSSSEDHDMEFCFNSKQFYMGQVDWAGEDAGEHLEKLTARRAQAVLRSVPPSFAEDERELMLRPSNAQAEGDLTRLGCHDAQPAEKCYESVMWAKTVGFHSFPEWYPNLTSESSFDAFQQQLHVKGECPLPCSNNNKNKGNLADSSEGDQGLAPSGRVGEEEKGEEEEESVKPSPSNNEKKKKQVLLSDASYDKSGQAGGSQRDPSFRQQVGNKDLLVQLKSDSNSSNSTETLGNRLQLWITETLGNRLQLWIQPAKDKAGRIIKELTPNRKNDFVHIHSCNGSKLQFGASRYLDRYLSMSMLAKIFADGQDISMVAIRLNKVYHVRLYLMICLTLKYVAKLADVISNVFAADLCIFQSRRRSRCDRALESFFFYGSMSLFCVVLQTNLSTAFLTIWRKGHFVTSWMPAMGFSIIFVHIMLLFVVNELDKMFNFMQRHCTVKVNLLGWVLFTLGATLMLIPLIGTTVFNLQCDWLNQEAPPQYSQDFGVAALNCEW